MVSSYIWEVVTLLYYLSYILGHKGHQIYILQVVYISVMLLYLRVYNQEVLISYSIISMYYMCIFSLLLDIYFIFYGIGCSSISISLFGSQIVYFISKLYSRCCIRAHRIVPSIRIVIMFISSYLKYMISYYLNGQAHSYQVFKLYYSNAFISII